MKKKALQSIESSFNVAGHQICYEMNRDYIKSKFAEMAKQTKIDPIFHIAIVGNVFFFNF